MADEYISRNAVIKRLEEKKSSICPNEPLEYERYRDICDAIDSDIDTVQNIQSSDVVTRDCYDRVLWENDIMRKQLAEIGKSFGENMGDVQKVVHAKAIKFYNDPFTGRMFTTCTFCDGKISSKDAYCKHCGAKMDL